MIITCNNCERKFEINSNLIPETGRLLQCSVCNHHWFFKKELKIEETVKVLEKIKKIPSEKENKEINIDINLEKLDEITIKKEIIKTDSAIKTGFLNSILVFIISSIALIIILDTFKTPISLVVPSIDLILYNLYETINDILLFFNDLFR